MAGEREPDIIKGPGRPVSARSFVESFVKRTTGLQLHQVGTVEIMTKPVDRLISTRRFLEVKPPQVISCDGIDYVVDGHHSLRHAIENGILNVDCAVVVLIRNNTHPVKQLSRKLTRMAAGPIGHLEILDHIPKNDRNKRGKHRRETR